MGDRTKRRVNVAVLLLNLATGIIGIAIAYYAWS